MKKPKPFRVGEMAIWMAGAERNHAVLGRIEGQTGDGRFQVRAKLFDDTRLTKYENKIFVVKAEALRRFKIMGE